MNLLSRLKIRTKLASMVVLAALAVCAIVALAASLSQSRMHEDRIAQLHTAVDMLVGLAQSLQDEVDGRKDDAPGGAGPVSPRARKMIFSNGQGYPIAYNADTSLMLNGANPQLEGKITGAINSNGVVIAKAQLEAARGQTRGRHDLLSVSPSRPDRPGPENGLCPQLRAMERRHELWALCR